ncbi:MAG: ABC transporter substrate-binding protein [Micromonosporaceae bacterium]
MPARLELRTFTRTQGSNQALKDGTLTPRTCAFDFVEVSPLIHAFRRMVRGLEFDVCELAFTTYLCARAYGKPFTALPIFLVRGMHHGAIVRNTKAGVQTPKDLEGTRVGVDRGYTVTTGVWVRGILQDEYGVDLSRVTWVLSGDEHVAEYRPPACVVPAGEGTDIAELLTTGRLAAAIGVSVDHPEVVPLIPNPTEAAFRALERQGLYPINHLLVVRDDLLDTHPDLAVDIFNAFTAAKNLYVKRLADAPVAGLSGADRTYRRVMGLNGDPLPYGVEPNRPMIEKLIAHAVTQKILDEPPAIESLFHPSTLGLTG